MGDSQVKLAISPEKLGKSDYLAYLCYRWEKVFVGLLSINPAKTKSLAIILVIYRMITTSIQGQ